MTDNPSGSTGQNATTPPNAPEAGSNGEREALARIVFDARFAEVEGWNDDARQANRELTEPTHLRIADAVVAAGFTRAHHRDDSERVAPTLLALYRMRDERDAACRERDEARAERDSMENLRDGAQSDRDVLIAERDALAGKLDRVLRTPQWLACAERDAAIARAEAAEKRAEGLAAALREARDMVADWAAYASPYFQEKHDLPGDLAKLDAALAGNGNGTGDG